MKTLVGKVISAKMNKTVAVKLVHLWRHPIYKKIVRRTKKFLAHDDIGVKEGDSVRIAETRPISKRKHWKVIELLTEDKNIKAKKIKKAKKT